MPPAFSIRCLLLLAVVLGGVQGQVYLRTGVVEPSRWNRLLLASEPAGGRASHADAKDVRWGPFLGRQPYLLQIPRGVGHQAATAILKALQDSGAIVGDYLPHDSYLLLADSKTVTSSLVRECSVAPYLPEYRIAPEWEPVLELVAKHYSGKAAAQSADHWGAHQAVISHPEVHTRLRMLHPTTHQQRRHRQLLQEQQGADAARSSSGSSSALTEQPLPPQLVIGVDFPFLHPEDLQPLGLDFQQFQPAFAAAAEWTSQLAQVVRDSTTNSSLGYVEYCQPQVHPSSSKTLTVSVCPKDLEAVLTWLSQQPSVYWLYPKPQIRFHNLNAGAITQGGVYASVKTWDSTKPETHPWWGRGLDGKGQVVGVGDSGIDMDSCYFFDPAAPFSSQQAPEVNGHKQWSSSDHRKVLAYTSLADPGMLDKVGHGSHVVGTIIGEKPGDRTDIGTGMAPGAKIVFLDLSQAADGADVNTPDNLMDDYFMINYNLGARVHSDSWGGWGAIYDTSSYYTDMMTWKNMDFLPVMAAGNYGTNEKYSSTVTSPATAKNCLTVGATLNYDPNYVSSPSVKIWTMTMQIKRSNLPDQIVIRRLVQAEFGGPMDGIIKAGAKVVLADPPNACQPLKPATGAVVLVRRGDCFFANKLQAASAAGAAGVIVISDRPGGYFKMEAKEGEAITSTIPMLGISKRLGDGLWTLITYADSASATFFASGTGQPSFDDVASFSSFGPTQDLRTKPDIVAPGNVYSAASDKQFVGSEQNCATVLKRGTSMATPVVAGNVLLIRQYFMDGFYPTGKAVAANTWTPSGPLMKAVVMGGAVDMVGNTVEGLPLDPMGRAGYGRVNLTNSLKVDGGKVNLQVVDLAELTQGAKHSYCITGTGGPLAVTLVWYDYPASPPSDPTAKLLINDLDLTVRADGLLGAMLQGNGIADHLNTVEKVTVADLPPGAVTIEVSAANLSAKTPSQKYALVAQGAFSGVLASPQNPDPGAKAATPGACAAAAGGGAGAGRGQAATAGSDSGVGQTPQSQVVAADATAATPVPPDTGSARVRAASNDAPDNTTPAAAPAAAGPAPATATAGGPGAADVAGSTPAPVTGDVPAPAAAAGAADPTAAAAVPPASPADEAQQPPPGPASVPPEPTPAPVIPPPSKDDLLSNLITSMGGAHSPPAGGQRRLAAVAATAAAWASAPLQQMRVQSAAAAAWCRLVQAGRTMGMCHASSHAVQRCQEQQLLPTAGSTSATWLLVAAVAALAVASALVVLLAAFTYRKLRPAGGQPSMGIKAAAPAACQPLLSSPGADAATAAAAGGAAAQPARARSSGLSRLVSRALSNSLLKRCQSGSSSALEKGFSTCLSGSLPSTIEAAAPAEVAAAPPAHAAAAAAGGYGYGVSRPHSDSELEVHHHQQYEQPASEELVQLSFATNLLSPAHQHQHQQHGSPRRCKTFTESLRSNSITSYQHQQPQLAAAEGAPPLGVVGGSGVQAWAGFPQVEQRRQGQGQGPAAEGWRSRSFNAPSLSMQQRWRQQQELQQEQQRRQAGSVVVDLSPPDSPLSGGYPSPWQGDAQQQQQQQPDCFRANAADRSLKGSPGNGKGW